MRHQWVASSVVLALVCAPVAGQQGTTKTQTVINGAVTPEMIPVVRRSGPCSACLRTARTIPRRGTYVSSILEPTGLTKAEQIAVVGAANVYGAKEASTNRALQSLREATPHKSLSEVGEAQVDALMAAQGAVLDKSIKDLQDEFQPESYQRLLQFIRTSWKHKMNFYPGPKLNENEAESTIMNGIV